MARPKKTWDDVKQELRTCVSKQPGGCWLWTGPRFNHGAGRIHYGGRQHQAHRLAWYALTGKWPDRVYQICRDPLCVSPHHLRGSTKYRKRGDPPKKVDPKMTMLVGMTGGTVSHLTVEPYRGEKRTTLCGRKASTVNMSNAVLSVLPLCASCESKIKIDTRPD